MLHHRTLLSVNAYHYRRGGADIAYLEHAALFERQGWRNHFFAMHYPDNLPSADEAFFAEEVSIDKARGLSARLKAAGRIVYSRDARQRVSRMLDRTPVDIVHAHSVYHHLSPSIFDEFRARNIPVVMTAHDLKLLCPAYKMMNSGGICEKCKGGKIWQTVANRCIKDSLAGSALVMLETAVHRAFRLYAKNLDRIVVPSRFYREKFIEWGWPAEQLIYIPNFVPASRQVDRGAGGGDFILYFGRLASEKGLMTLVEAAAAAGTPVVLAGQGPDEEALRRRVAELGAPVSFAGLRQGEALWSLVRQARAVVLPSEWYENAPLSVIEAFREGKPLIGADIGGIPELFDEGETGWAFRSGDKEDLSRALAIAWNTPEPALSEMAQACRALAASRHSEAAYYQSMQALYDDVLTRRVAPFPDASYPTGKVHEQG
jgi:glycosyltransferase involved in cell wall biosynthesis